MKKLLFVTTALMLLFASPVLGAPSVSSFSGTANDGQSVAISGSGFGAKATSKPSRWDTFQGGTVGSAVSALTNSNLCSVTSNWVTHYQQEPPKYSTAQVRAGRSKSVYHNFYDYSYDNGNQYDCFYTFDYPSPQHEIYVTFWLWHHIYSVSRNAKYIRVYGSQTISGQGFPQITYGEMYSSGQRSAILTNLDENMNSQTTWTGSIPEDTWVRLELFAHTGTANGGNGYATWNWMAPDTGATGSWTTPTGTFITNNNDGYLEPHFAEYVDRGPTESIGQEKIYTGDAYADVTQARIEIGDKSTWSASKHKEIQIPTAWSSNSINFIVNQGSFANGASAYVYVVDSTGAVNANGYPITIGSGGGTPPPTDTTPPAAPKGLKVQ